MKVSGVVVIAALVAFGCLALAAILLVADTDGATDRLALFFGMLGLIIPALIGAFKSDQASSRLNGTLDRRIHDAVLMANKTRREADPE